MPIRPLPLVLNLALLASVPALAASLSTASAAERAPLEEQLFEDVADGRLDRFPLLDAALIAGGVREPEQLAECRKRYAALRTLAQQELPPTDSPRARAAALYRLLHRELLDGRYQADCNELATTLRTGDYNCLTATVLFNCLAADFDLPVVAMETTGHIRSRLEITPPIDVETTCSEWFLVLDNPQLLRRYEAGLPARRQLSGPVHFTPITDVQLVARVYYNRGVARLRGEKFAQAVALTKASLRIDADNAIAHGNLLAGLNNWALDDCKQGRYKEASARLAELRQLDPYYGPLAGNDLHLQQQWVQFLLAQHQYAAAYDVLAAAYERRPDVRLFDLGRFSVYRQWAAWHLAAGRTELALQVFSDARRQHPQRAEVLELEAGAINDEAIRLVEANRREEAIALLDLGLERQPGHGLLGRNRELLLGTSTAP